MDLVQKLLEARAGELVRNLTAEADFEEETARSFAPAAASAALDAMKARAGDLDSDRPASSSNVATLLDQIDLGSLAKRVGIGPEKASRGLAVVLPLILGFLGEKAGGEGGLGRLLGLAGGLDDAADRLKGLGDLLG